MSKTVRIVLYILSILTVIGVIAAFIVSGQRQGASEVMQEGNVPAETEDAVLTGTEDTVLSGTEDAVLTGAEETMPTETEGTGNAETGNENTAGSEAAGTEAGEQTDGTTTILFTGDVLFANAFKAGYDASGIDGVIDQELLQELKQADILMVNNEFPFSDQGTPMADKQFTFQCSPSYVTALTEMGVDVVSLANNHTLDYGKEALRDTFSTLDKAGILYGGAGETVERAEEVQVMEVNGKKYGFIAVSRVIPVADWKVENSAPGLFSCYDETRLVELVKQAKEYCDFVAVYPHWGVEYQAYPEAYQTWIAERCIEAGADVIVGSHTHCLQGVSYIDGKPVFYSLGNFIFGQNIDRSAVVKVTVDAAGNASYELIPVYAEGGVTYKAKGDKGTRICQYIDGISEASIGADGSVGE